MRIQASAVKLAEATGAAVTVFTRSADKVEDAKCFGASSIVIGKDGADLKALAHAFDFARDTVLQRHTIHRFVPLLERDAT